MGRIISIPLLLTFLLCFSLVAWPQDNLQPQHKWEFRVSGGSGKVVNDHRKDTGVSYAAITIGKIVAGHPGGTTLSYCAEIAPLFVVQQESKAYGTEVVPFLLKWRSSSQHHVRPFLDFGGGMLFSNADVPENTSSVNFTPQVRFGADFPTRENEAFSLALHYIHISNADFAERNRGYNSVNLQFGYSWSR